MKRLDLVEYDCGPGCSSYGQVIAADLERETENPRPADIPESSGEQFPPYMVAPGGAAPLRPAKGGLSVKKVARAI